MIDFTLYEFHTQTQRCKVFDFRKGLALLNLNLTFLNVIKVIMNHCGNILDKSKIKSGKDGNLTNSLGNKINLRR